MRYKLRTRSVRSDCSLIGALLFLLMAGGCNRAGNEPVAPLSLQLSSAGLSNGVLGKTFTCEGAGQSPPLSWSAPPPQTRSFALVVTDRDSPFGYNFVHWVVYDIPVSARELPAGLPVQTTLSDGALQGRNDKGTPGYTPPCPPGKSSHRYDFILYAIDENLELPSASKKQLLHAIRGHVLAKGELIGHYGR